MSARHGRKACGGNGLRVVWPEHETEDFPPMSDPYVLYEVRGRIALLTLNRPDMRNAIGEHSDCAELVEAVERAGADPNVSVLVLTGSGPAFSAGGNLKGMRDRDGIGPLATPADTRDNYRRGVQKIALAFANLEIASIAAVNGHAVGLRHRLPLRHAGGLGRRQICRQLRQDGHCPRRRRGLDPAARHRLR